MEAYVLMFLFYFFLLPFFHKEVIKKVDLGARLSVLECWHHLLTNWVTVSKLLNPFLDSTFSFVI